MSHADGVTRRGFLLGRFLDRFKPPNPMAGEGGEARPVCPEEGGSSASVPIASVASDVLAFGRRPGAIPILRPPGAIEESAFLAGCTRCGACIDACPHGALVPAPARFRAAAGTPMIDPLEAPCRLCPDTPCISACEPAVLTRLLPPRMGTAQIQSWSCLAYQRSFCSTCVERCPVPGAIELEAGRPRVVADRCTGCGVCQHVCPAPANAVMILPVLERPAPEVAQPGDLP